MASAKLGFETDRTSQMYSVDTHKQEVRPLFAGGIFQASCV